MRLTEFDIFLGKHLNQIIEITGALRHNDNLNSYSFFSEEGCDYYGKSYHTAKIKTNDHQIIKEITVYIHRIIDEPFYNAFNEIYGLPSDIRVVDTIKTSTEDKLEEKGILSSSAKSVTTYTKKGRFDDNPLLMIWNKKDYEIITYLKYEINISEITFKSTT